MWSSLVFCCDGISDVSDFWWIVPWDDSFDCFFIYTCSYLLILILVMIAPYGLLKSQLNVGNILLHCCKLILAMSQSYHF